MNRREFLAVCSAAPWVASARPAFRSPGWLDEGIIMVGSWEPPIFLVRRGGQEDDAVERWKQERTEASIRRLREEGVNLIITNLHKGFGLLAEADAIETTRVHTQLAHRYGIRVGGYVGATMMYETFFHEEPAGKDWMQIDEFGQPVYYGRDQTFRYAACRNNPGYHQFLLKVIRLGVVDLKMDMIHFDQMNWWAEPNSCRCVHCRRGFQEFLRARHDSAGLKKRFGFTRVEDLAPPPLDGGPPVLSQPEVRNPLVQDWVLFRTDCLNKRFAEYAAFIRGLNPEVAVEGNPNLNLAINLGFLRGTDVPGLLDHGDILWSEEPNHAAWSNGSIISKVRSFKSVRIMGKSLFVYTGSQYGPQAPESPPELVLAEAMAFNGANLGMVGDLAPDGVGLSPGARRYIRFFRDHLSDFTGTRSRADVAVLRSFASIEFNPARSNVSTVLFEQTLLQSRIPFDIVFSRHLRDLSQYKVLVLANQDALSDDEVASIREFVRRGGGLVATEDSSLLTEWRLRRPALGLADVLGTSRPAHASLWRSWEAGRAVYLPRIEPATAPPPATSAYNFSSEHWRLPRNAEELAKAVRWTARGELTVEADAPPSVAIELTEKTTGGVWMLHLINFDLARQARDIAVRFRIPRALSLSRADWLSPDEETAGTLSAEVRNGVHHFRLPRLRTYALIRLRFGGAR